MKGKLFSVFFRNKDANTERRTLNGRGEKKQFLMSAAKRGIEVLDIARVRDPAKLNALRMRM